MTEEEKGTPEPQKAPEVVEKRLSEHLNIVQVALEVAGPVLGGVAGAVTSHVMNNKPAEDVPPAPPSIELPPGVHADGDA